MIIEIPTAEVIEEENNENKKCSDVVFEFVECSCLGVMIVSAGAVSLFLIGMFLL